MSKSISLLIGISLILIGCSPTPNEKTGELKKDTVLPADIRKIDTVKEVKPLLACINDSLNATANIMSGISDSSSVLQFIQSSSDFKVFSNNFTKRWLSFDSSRLTSLRDFKEKELSQVIKPQSTLFYPFSGPDILYAQTFFPEADKYIMIGLEPVGSIPEFKETQKDSLGTYFNKLNTALHAILNYSFFRTQSMNKDLRNTKVDGTLHLLFLFLKRTNNQLCSAKPITVDSTGSIQFLNSFTDLKKLKAPVKGIEIQFTDINNKPKSLYYFSLNAADGGLKSNNGFMSYLENMGTINTYLKGASYLMHKSYFSMIRNIILNQSEQVIQDDSGIALHYFTNSNAKWNYAFYGQYLKPIPMFSQFYQKDLDSLYKQNGSKPIGFGIGYNFKDKNSNFIIATKHR